MPHIADLLELCPPARRTLSTGFDRLDDLTDGFNTGSLWLVTGTPGQGCTTLLTQWAARLAIEHGLPTWLVAPRDDEHHCASRLVSTVGKVSAQQLARGEITAIDASRLQVGRSKLSSSQLIVRCSSSAMLPMWDEPEGRALVIDDVDQVVGATPSHLSRLADAGAVVLASLPRHLLVQDRRLDGDLDPEWARSADVILEVRSNCLENDHDNRRRGEADVTVLKHRRGPTRTFAVSFEPHYARLADLRE